VDGSLFASGVEAKSDFFVAQVFGFHSIYFALHIRSKSHAWCPCFQSFADVLDMFRSLDTIEKLALPGFYALCHSPQDLRIVASDKVKEDGFILSATLDVENQGQLVHQA
jgi:hypothetical protein